MAMPGSFPAPAPSRGKAIRSVVIVGHGDHELTAATLLFLYASRETWSARTDLPPWADLRSSHDSPWSLRRVWRSLQPRNSENLFQLEMSAK